MVGIAQLVELWIVIPAVVGSNPIVHPRYEKTRYRQVAGFFVCQINNDSS